MHKSFIYLTLALVCCLLIFSGQQTYISNSDKETAISNEINQLINANKGKKKEHCHDFWKEIELHKVKIEKTGISYYLNVHQHLISEYDDHLFEEIGLGLYNLTPPEYNLNAWQILVKNKAGEYVEYSTFSNEPPRTYPAPDKNTDPGLPIRLSDQIDFEKQLKNPNTSQVQPTGSLSGKTVWISPGHGWLYFSSLGTYSTQRGNTNDMVEDFASIETVNYYLLQYLYNAGANVWMVRERDNNPNEVIVDNSESGYSETGTWFTTTSTGYSPATGRPNGANGYRYTWADPNATTATATWTPNIPESGWYWISTQYRSGANRIVDCQFQVTHAGGTSNVSINQEVHGLTWVYLGRFYFDAGTGGSVTMLNQTSDPTAQQVVIADAMRFGGGVNTAGSGAARAIPDCGTPSIGQSNKLRFEESARQYAQYQNYPTCRGDVTMRPFYSEYELAKGTAQEKANSCYISWHSNAANSTARGTLTFAHSTAPTPNSYDLQSFVHNELINGIRNGWDPSWNDRGVAFANFGEIRELSTMPGLLLETVFHDNATDAQQYTTPEFRNIMARGVYKGIVKFFNDRDNSPITMVPEPPTHVFAKNTGNGEITVSWNTPPANNGNGVLGDPATGYKLYIGTHGKAFADGIAVTGNSHVVPGLLADKTYYFRVAATNPGGESFQSATVAARTPSAGVSAIDYLIVDGYDRLDRSSALRITSSTQLVNLRRLFLEKMNSYDYMVEHAKSLEYCGVSFDGASNEAVIQGDAVLGDYTGVNWYLGEESTFENTFDAVEKQSVIAYLNGGGNLIVSGAEIGWEIGRAGSPNADLPFYNNYLKATYAGDDGNTYNFAGVANGIFDGISGKFDDNTEGYYDTDYPDRLGASGGSAVIMNYSGGTGDGAAVAYKGNDFGVVNFGFPLETITATQVRNDIMCAAVTFLAPEAVALPMKALLEGPYDQVAATMSDQLRVSNYLPTTHPYGGAPWNYTGGESVANGVFAISGNDAITDWVLVELRAAGSPSTVVARKAALLQRDGDVVGMDGVSDLELTSISPGSYHVAIIHRNHLGAMTQQPIAVSRTTPKVDMTSVPLFGTRPVKTYGNIQLLWTGDTDSNQTISASDRSQTWNDRNNNGYRPTDSNLDGICNALDRSKVWNNRNLIGQLP